MHTELKNYTVINLLISITINLIKLEYFKSAEISTVVVDVAGA